MKSGTEKRPNPKTAPLGKFLRALARPTGRGYVQTRSGQLVREDTWERWQAEGRR
jgi:hypothetical protein